MMFTLPLDERETARLYWELSRRGAYGTGKKEPWKYKNLSEEELLTLAVLHCRYDPRFMAIMVDFFQTPLSIDPVQFKKILRGASALQITAVIGEFVVEQDLFSFLMNGVKPVPTQLFYHGLYPLGSRKMEEVIDRPLWPFKKWGFLASDPPLLKDRHQEKIYLFDQTSRLHILRELAQRGTRFRLKDYLQEIHFSISRQQALKDLRVLPFLRKFGKGKGSYWGVNAKTRSLT